MASEADGLAPGDRVHRRPHLPGRQALPLLEIVTTATAALPLTRNPALTAYDDPASNGLL